jgi:hypothetical protein
MDLTIAAEHRQNRCLAVDERGATRHGPMEPSPMALSELLGDDHIQGLSHDRGHNVAKKFLCSWAERLNDSRGVDYQYRR